MIDAGVPIATVENNFADQLPKWGPNAVTIRVDNPARLYGFAGAGAGAARSASLITMPDMGSIQVR